ncbi:MAG: DUF1573 domain-containing protein [Gemmataceae bacterium]
MPRLLAIVLFGTFVFVNVGQLRNGKRSCGCLGRIQAKPEQMLALDVVALATLAWCHRRGRTSHVPNGEGMPQRRVGRWEKVLAAGGVGLLLTGVMTYTYFRPNQERFDDVTLSPAAHDFGSVRQGDSLTHVFMLRNDSALPVKVVSVHSSCGCTTADGIVGRVVQPGGALPTPVTLKAGTTDGLREATLTLFLRQPGHVAGAWRSAEVRAVVGVDYWVRPTLIEFGTVRHYESPVRVVRLRPNIMGDVRIARVQCSHPAFVVRQVPAPPGSQDIHLEVTARVPEFANAGPVAGMLTLYTTSTRAPEAVVQIRADLAPAVVAEPACVVVGTEADGPVVRPLTLRSVCPMRVVRVHGGVVRCERRTTSDGVGYPGFDLTIPAGDPAGGITEQLAFDLEVTTAGGATEARTVVVPVYRLPRAKG